MKNQIRGALALVVGMGTGTVVLGQPLAGEGDAIRITGCVVAGTNDRSVMLVQVSEGAGLAARETWMGADGLEAPPGREVAYWLDHDSVKTVRGHIGQRVEITGTVTDISSGTVTVDKQPGRTGGDNKVEVDKGSKAVKAATDEAVGTPSTTGAPTREKKTVMIHRIKVGTVKSIAATCS